MDTEIIQIALMQNLGMDERTAYRSAVEIAANPVLYSDVLSNIGLLQQFGGDISPNNENTNQQAVPGYGFGDMLGTAISFGTPMGIAGTLAGLGIDIARGVNPTSLGLTNSLSRALGYTGLADALGFGGRSDPGTESLGFGGFTHADDMFGGITGPGDGGVGFGGGYSAAEDAFGGISGEGGPGADGSSGSGGGNDPGGDEGQPGDAYHAGGYVEHPDVPFGGEFRPRMLEGEFVMPIDAVLYYGTKQLSGMINEARRPDGRRGRR